MESIEKSSLEEDPLNSEKRKLRLRTSNTKYTIIKNNQSILAARPLSWWSTFNLPTKLDENDQYQRIFGRVTCFKCYQTFIYSSKSGTTRLKEHQHEYNRYHLL